MDLIYLIKLLLRRIKLLLIVPIICMILAYVLTINLPSEYKSEAQLSTGFTVNESVANAEEFNIRDAGIKFINAIETMKSPIVLNLVSYKLLIHDLQENVSFTSLELNEAYQNIEKIKTHDLTKSEIINIIEEKVKNFELLNTYDNKENLILKVLRQYEYDYTTLLKKIEIYRVSMSDFIKIEFESEDPLLSAYVVNTLAEEFIRYRKSSQSNINTESLAYYNNILQQKKEEINKKTKELNTIKSQGNVIDFQIQSETQLQQISNYENEKDNSIQKIQALEISIQNIENKIETLPLNNSTENTSNHRIIDLQTKIKELNNEYVKSGSSDNELKELIDQLRNELINEINKSAEPVNGKNKAGTEDLIAQKEEHQLELEIEKNNLRNLENKLSLLKGNMSGIANKEAVISSLNKEIEKLTDEYLNTLDVYNKEKNKSLVADSNIKLIVPGQPAEEPESSKRIILILLSGFLSFFILFGYLTTSLLLNSKLKTPAIFENQTHLILFGVINKIIDNNLDIDEIFNKNKVNNQSEKFKQSLRKLRHEIEQLNNKIILITSTKNGEGKTFIILSLAYSLSLINKRILIIDTNFKHNSLTQILLNKSFDKNLITDGVFKNNLLANPKRKDNTIEENNENRSIINTTMHKNIDIIGNQAHDNSPSEIFTGKDFSTMLTELTYTYDYILLEGASLNDYSDTKELVNYVDKVIPVFSADNSLSQMDKESIRYLKSLNGKLSGSVLNKINLNDLKI